MDKISIIIPVYNVKDYLDRCLNSVISQTYTNIEIILVDDGSTDGSSAMCDDWKYRDDRIKVVHKENGGLSSARNKGLDIATGEYVGFVDSDDWIEANMYELLYRAIKEASADLALSNMVIAKTVKDKAENKEYKSTVLNKEDLYKVFFRVSDYNINYCVCDKLFKRNTIGNHRFTEGIILEDIDFMFPFIQKCNTAVQINQSLYYWFYNYGSITRKCVSEKDKDVFYVWKKIVDETKILSPELEYYAKMNLCRAHMGIIAKACKFGVSETYTDWENDRNTYVKYLRRNYFKLLKWKMPMSRKLLLTVICINPNIVSNMFRSRKGD